VLHYARLTKLYRFFYGSQCINSNDIDTIDTKVSGDRRVEEIECGNYGRSCTGSHLDRFHGCSSSQESSRDDTSSQAFG
jgi:hypothetical protein